MKKFDDIVKIVFIKALIKKGIIYERDGKYYSACNLNEEVTIELKDIFEE